MTIEQTTAYKKSRQVGMTKSRSQYLLLSHIKSTIEEMHTAGITPGYIVVGGAFYLALDTPEQLAGLPVYPIDMLMIDFTFRVMPIPEHWIAYWEHLNDYHK